MADFLIDDGKNKIEGLNKAQINAALSQKADSEYVNTELDKKADKNNTYTKSQVDNIANGKMNKSNPSGTGNISVGSNMLNAGYNSQTFGNNTKAFNQNTFAAGEGTTAGSNNQFVFGKYNNEDWIGKYVEIVGNGTNGHGSNARTLDWEGNETIAGDLKYNGNKSLTAEVSRLDQRITDLPEAMVIKGTLGINGTIQELPIASAENEGYTYKCITAGIYSGLTLKIGDTVTCYNPEGTSVFEWFISGYGDTDTDTWRPVKINGSEVLGVGISGGSVDFSDGENIKPNFDDQNNKITFSLDGVYTSAEVDEIIYNVLPDGTASGAIANFETSLALPIKSMQIDVNAQQESGTPTPQSPKSISGVNEVNINHAKKNIYVYDAGKVAIGITNTETTRSYLPLGFKGAGNYSFSVSLKSGETPTTQFINIGKRVNGILTIVTSFIAASNLYNKTVTFSEGEEVILMSANESPNAITSSLPKYDIQIEVGSEITNFDETQINTTLINLEGTYYGGHLIQDKSGHRRFEVTHGYYNLNTLSWTYNANGFWQANKPDDMARCSASDVPRVIAEKYQMQTGTWVYGHGSTYGYFGMNGGLIYITDENTPSGYIVAPLGTPTYIELTDGEPLNAFIGTNNIFADSGNVSVVFKQSVNNAINAAVNAANNGRSLGVVNMAKSGENEEEKPEEVEEPKEETKK